MFALALAVSLAAAPAPMALIKSADEAVTKLLANPNVTPAALADEAEKFVDFGELAKRALGKEWDKLKAPQQKDFSDTMKGLLRASYAQKAIKGGRGKAVVTYGKETVKGDEAQVATSMKIGEDTIPVDYKLYRASAKGEWKVFDVVTDGDSLLTNYSDQFRKTLASKGFDGLLTTLKARREQLENPAPAPEAKN